MARIARMTGIALLSVVVLARVGLAVQPAKDVLPSTTKGYISVPDVDGLREKWNQTQFGQMMSDPLMKPFVEDLQRQLKEKLSQTSMRLGLTWEDVAGVYGGEVSVALIQPDGDEKQHALALLVDVSDRDQQVEALLAKIDGNMTAKESTVKSTERIHEVEVVSYKRPPADGELRPRNSHFAVVENQLVVTDHLGAMSDVIANMKGAGSGKSLAELPAFRQSMEKSQDPAAKSEPHVRWFVEPFGYAQATRAMSGGRRKKGPDMLKILADQGFTAAQGLGGVVTLATEDHELEHRSFIYAPPTAPVQGDDQDGEQPVERYRLAARMLDFPNQQPLTPQEWVPVNLATYLTFNWRMKEAFEHSKTLVDQIADAEVFEEVLESIKNDANGPRVDLRNDLVAHFDERATLLTDYRLPITPKSERIMFAIQVNDPDAVAEAIDRAMKVDRNAKPRIVDGHKVWEIINEEGPDIRLKIDGGDGAGGFGFGDEFGEDEEKKEDAPILPNSAITVLKVSPKLGQLIIASHVDHIADVLNQRKNGVNLDQASDYKRVDLALKQMGAGVDSFRFFSRTDDAYRPTYELIRENKMPEAETMLGKLLNSLLGPDEEGVLREQQIDGKKMPRFESVKKYLGPAGLYVRSTDDGWLAAGCVLRKLVDDSEIKDAPNLNSARAEDKSDVDAY